MAKAPRWLNGPQRPLPPGAFISASRTFSGSGLALGNRSAYLGSDLFVEEGRITRVDLETVHNANYTSTTKVRMR
jgi:hypothetical protein